MTAVDGMLNVNFQYKKFKCSSFSHRIWFFVPKHQTLHLVLVVIHLKYNSISFMVLVSTDFCRL